MPVPPQIPVVHFTSPAYGDTMLVEPWNTELGSYKAQPYGSPHPNVEKWSGYILVKQEALPGDEKWVLRYYVADDTVPNTYNIAKETYDGEDITKEILVRTYLYRRVDYVPLTKKTALSGVLGVRMTNTGTTYDSTATVTFSGGGGAGATGVPIVFRGTIVGAYITAEGAGYTSAPTVTFSAPVGGGTLATGTSVIPRATAILVEEGMDRMDGAPEDGIYVKVTRVYHVLPGAEIVSYTAGAGGKLKRVRKQKVALPAYPTTTGYGMLGAKVEGISTVMGLQTLEDWVNADGTTTGNPVPWLTHRETIEPEGVELMTWVKTVDSNTLPPAMGATSIVTADETINLATHGRRRIPTFPSGITNAGEWQTAQAYVVHAELRQIEDSMNLTLIVQTCPIPRTRYEFPFMTYKFPALFSYVRSGATPDFTLINGRVPINWTLLSQTYTPHRTKQIQACELMKYSVGPTAALPEVFTINSPGAASVFMSFLDAETIYGDPTNHDNFPIYILSGITPVESFYPSTVTGCAKAGGGAVVEGTLPVYYRLRVDQKPWRGNLWVRTYTIVMESGDIVGDANNGRFNSTSDTNTSTYLFCD